MTLLCTHISAKLVPVGYGIKKLQISCVVEDDKVSTDDLEEQIVALEDYVSVSYYRNMLNKGAGRDSKVQITICKNPQKSVLIRKNLFLDSYSMVNLMFYCETHTFGPSLKCMLFSNK